MTPTVAALFAALTDFFRDRPIVLVGRPLCQYTRIVSTLSEFGARAPLVLANGLGSGSAPDRIAQCVIIDLGVDGYTGTARATDQFLRSPSAVARQALDRYDPERRALVLVDSNVSHDTLAGRRVADGRSAVWAGLEDAPAVDAILRAVQAPRLPARLTRCDAGALRSAHEDMDLGRGTLWFGDSRAGPRLSWEQAWLVGSSDDAAEATSGLAECDWIRVLPNVSGIPAAVAGLVLPDGVAVLSPAEELVLGRPEGGRFRYAGASTYYDPAGALSAMRSVARSVGRFLAAQHGFRGAFAVSGIVRGEDFLAVDLLTRLAAPHHATSRALPELPWPLLQAAVVSGHDLGVSAVDVEETVGAGVMAAPWSVATLDVPKGFGPGRSTCWLTRDGGGLRAAAPGEPSRGCLVLDQSSARGAVSIVVGPGLLTGGGLMGEAASAAFALSDRMWCTGLGALKPLGR